MVIRCVCCGDDQVSTFQNILLFLEFPGRCIWIQKPDADLYSFFFPRKCRRGLPKKNHCSDLLIH